MKLTNIQIKNAKPKDKMYRLSDGDNFYLEVHPNGSKYWRMGYRYNEKRRQVSCGKYPLISLQEAREIKVKNKKLLLNGIDPVAAKKQEQLDRKLRYESNLEAIAREWHAQRQHTWKPDHAANIMKRLEKYIFPTLGQKPIMDIKPPELLHVLRPIEAAGKLEMAHRMQQTCGQIFRYAVACGKTERDITQDLKGALKPSVSQNYKHLKEKDLPAFLRKLNIYDQHKNLGGCNGNPITKWGLQLLIMTFLRTKEIRFLKWDYIDFDKAQIRLPDEIMKMGGQHIVPLASQAVRILRRLQEITGDSYHGYVFPSFQNPRKTISENTFLKAIDNMGYKEETTGHDFRTTASTILNENGFRGDAIERQLAHCERNQVRAVYNHAEYLPERTEMMQWYADYLEKKGMVIDE